MPEKQRADDIEELLSEEKSLGSRKQTLIDDLLKQREAAGVLFDEKLSKLGYYANSNHVPQPGDKMPDGTIFAGLSPDNGKKMFAMPADAPLTYTFDEAKEFAAGLDAHGHSDWRVPSRAELNVLFNNRAAIGGFKLTGTAGNSFYWSASRAAGRDAWTQRFEDGYQVDTIGSVRAAVRCVRKPSIPNQ